MRVAPALRLDCTWNGVEGRWQRGSWTPQTDIINMNIARLICKVLCEKGSEDCDDDDEDDENEKR